MKNENPGKYAYANWQQRQSLCNEGRICVSVCVCVCVGGGGSPAAVILVVTLVPAGLSQFCTNTLNPVQ